MEKTVIFMDKSAQFEEDVARILAQVVHHIHPKIVSMIQDDNYSFAEEFKNVSSRLAKLKSDVFLHPGSDCVFPGVRRPVNGEKKGKWKNNILKSDGTILNDNTFPRHIWSYLVLDRYYDGKRWADSKLCNFELAHVFSHKEDERITEPKVFESFKKKGKPYYLFTSASNIVLLPKGMMKPTDNMENVKIAFYKRHLDLYEKSPMDYGNLIAEKIPLWYDKLQWNEPVLPDDWETKIKNLLAYRRKWLFEKYSKF